MGKSLSGTERAKVALRHGVYPNVGWTDVDCYWCGATGQLSWILDGARTIGWITGRRIEFDHYVPQALGGENTADNTVLACRPCNRSKKDQAPDEWTGRAA